MIRKIINNKKEFLPFLLLADEQESMINRYIEKGEMYALYDDGLKSICIVTNEGDGVLEIKNIATVPDHQRKGYAKKLIEFLVKEYSGRYSILQVGTGDSPFTIPFYEKCGFSKSHSINDFFIENYDHEIYEGGFKLKDVIYLRMDI